MTTTPILTQREREFFDVLDGRDPRYFGPNRSNGGTWQEVIARAKFDSLDAAGKEVFKAQEEARKTADNARQAAEDIAWLDGVLAEVGMESAEDAGAEGSAKATVAAETIAKSEPHALLVSAPTSATCGKSSHTPAANDAIETSPTTVKCDTTCEIDPELEAMLADFGRPARSTPSVVVSMCAASSISIPIDTTGVVASVDTFAAASLAADASEPLVTSAASTVKEVSITTDFSGFPVASVLEVADFDDPVGKMMELCRELLKHKDYGRVRDDYCKLSIRLNMIGKLAPAYRQLLSIEAKRGDPVHMLVHRDRIVIDLHWCYATKMQLMPLDPVHKVLFDADANFQFDLAWELAGKKWKSEYRAVEALCLTTLQQCQLLKLRGPEVIARQDTVEKGWRASGGKSVSKLSAVKRQLGQWAENDKRIEGQRDYYENLWLARELLKPGAADAQIAALHALMIGGEVQDRTTIRDGRKRLDKHVSLV